MSRSALDRRHVLLNGLTALAALPAMEAIALPRLPFPGTGSLASRAAGLFGSRTDAAALGRSYLAQHPYEADVERLLEALFADMPSAPSGGGEEREAEAIRAWVARRIEDDFRRARVARVEGWILARSEARLCAIASLA